MQVPVDYEVDDLEEGDADEYYYDDEEEEEEQSSWIGGSTAAKFLLAGGVAGAGAFCVSCLPWRVLIVCWLSVTDMHGTI